ncbi:MAG TPA: GNAT family N-acetyltransferase [Ktedonobacterales bacterium]|nr:GNAT family N-acetyltransferase [Ktedonobacterales bacterium]
MSQPMDRPYAGEADYAQLRDLLTAMPPLSGPAVYCTAGDLDWWRYSDDDPMAIQLVHLWFADAALLGFAWPKDDQVDLLAHPHYRDIEPAMLHWAESARRLNSKASEPLSLRAWAYDGDTRRTALLRGQGYVRTDTSFVYRSRTLDVPIPALHLPSGYTLRQLEGHAEIEQRVAVHRAAFTGSHMSVAKHCTLMDAPTYRADLDLVAVAPDGAFAAFGIVWLDIANRLGVFEPVGTHPAHRRQGLGQAILSEGMRRLQRLGARAVYVNSRGEDVAASRLYESVGFGLFDRNHAWKKSLYRTPAGSAPSDLLA